MDQDIRWKQRFENFSRSVSLLREPVDRGIETLSTLEMEGTVQRFEVALELAWKTLKDYLVHEGYAIVPITPRNVIKEAFAANIIEDGHLWMEMLDHRNLLSHTYDQATFEAAVAAVKDKYLSALEALHAWLTTQST